jgi:hypothetical protein
MDLQPRSEQITVQKEFLYQTAGAIYKVGGITLNGSQFTAGEFVKAGTAVAIDKVTTDGTTETTVPDASPYEPSSSTTIADPGQVHVIAHDVKIPEDGRNVVVGALEEAFLNRNKITGVAAADEDTFITDSNYRFKLRG